MATTSAAMRTSAGTRTSSRTPTSASGSAAVRPRPRRACRSLHSTTRSRCMQGVIINAGGSVAYYPSRFPLHRRAEFLGDRDLFGELARAAHEDGLAVLARMDSNRAHEEFYGAHPDWFAVDADGKPFRAGELFVACIHGPYYDEWIP